MKRKRYTREQAVRLLVRLVTATERENLTSQSRQALSELLQARIGDLVVRPAALQHFSAASERDVERWFRRVRVLLRESARLNLPGMGYALAFQPGNVQIRGLTLHGDAAIEVEGQAGSLLLVQAIGLLRATDARNRLRICDCDRLFLRIGKRRHCSERCQKRVYMRRFRAGEAGKE